MWLLYILLVSAFGVLVVLFAKIKEIKNGRQTVVGKFVCKGDAHVMFVWKKIESVLHYHGERTFFLFLVHIPSRTEAFFKSFRARAHNYYHGVSTKIRDRRNLSDNRISPYMRSMSFRRDGEGRGF